MAALGGGRLFLSEVPLQPQRTHLSLRSVKGRARTPSQDGEWTTVQPFSCWCAGLEEEVLMLDEETVVAAEEADAALPPVFFFFLLLYHSILGPRLLYHSTLGSRGL